MFAKYTSNEAKTTFVMNDTNWNHVKKSRIIPLKHL